MSEEPNEQAQQPNERRRRRRRTHQPMADAGNEGSPSAGLPWLAWMLLLWVVLSVTTVLLVKRCVPLSEDEANGAPAESMSQRDIDRVRAAHDRLLRGE